MNKKSCELKIEKHGKYNFAVDKRLVIVESKDLIHYCLTQCKDVSNCIKKTKLVRAIDKNIDNQSKTIVY